MRYFKIPLLAELFFIEKSDIDQSQVTYDSEALGQKLGYDSLTHHIVRIHMPGL